MGACRVLPRTCAPPDHYAVSTDELINKKLVEDFIDQVWNYHWQPADEYYFLPPLLRSALNNFLDPGFVRYRRDKPTPAEPLGALKRGSGPYGLGSCVKRVHEVFPDLVATPKDLIVQGDRVVAVLELVRPDPLGGDPLFRSVASVMYRLSGLPNNRKIVEDWATCDGLFLE